MFVDIPYQSCLTFAGTMTCTRNRNGQLLTGVLIMNKYVHKKKPKVELTATRAFFLSFRTVQQSITHMYVVDTVIGTLQSTAATHVPVRTPLRLLVFCRFTKNKDLQKVMSEYFKRKFANFLMNVSFTHTYQYLSYTNL